MKQNNPKLQINATPIGDSAQVDIMVDAEITHTDIIPLTQAVIQQCFIFLIDCKMEPSEVFADIHNRILNRKIS